MNVQIKAAVLAGIAGLMLSACGGGGGGNSGGSATTTSPSPGTEGSAQGGVGQEIPSAQAASVASNPEAVSVFVKSIVDAGSSELGEGFELGDLALAKSETDDPDPSI